jgi:hypothetical protein
MTEGNGADPNMVAEVLKHLEKNPGAVAQPTPEMMAAAQAAANALGPIVRQAFGMMLRGTLVSSPGVHPTMILNIVAWQMGNLLAGSVSSDINTLAIVRKGIQSAFADGIQKAPIVHTPPPSSVPMKLRG